MSVACSPRTVAGQATSGSESPPADAVASPEREATSAPDNRDAAVARQADASNNRAAADGGASAAKVDAEPDAKDRHGFAVPEEYRDILALLDHLAEEFEYEHSRTKLDPDLVGRYLMPEGLEYRNANEGMRKHVIVPGNEVLRQVRQRKGRVFKSLVHLGYLYGHMIEPLRFTPLEDGVIVKRWQFYSLRFVRHGNRWLLKRLEYVMIEGD
jgi:hypothetical protein